MESVVLETYINGAQDTLKDSHIDYDNGKVITFFFLEDAMFENFVTTLYEILNKSLNEYSPTMKENVKSTYSTHKFTP